MTRPIPPLQTAPLFRLSLDIAAAQDLRAPSGRGTIIVPVTGGWFEGARLRGTVLPDGADWIRAEADHAKVDVRIVLETDDGALIAMAYRGVHTITDAIKTRLASGEDVPASDYYFRTAPFFETAAPQYAWMNRMIAVGVGKRTATAVEYDVFEVL
ncbi:MAG: DUF3237 domain-containing protein [Paracoccaceae bacterium]